MLSCPTKQIKKNKNNVFLFIYKKVTKTLKMSSTKFEAKFHWLETSFCRFILDFGWSVHNLRPVSFFMQVYTESVSCGLQFLWLLETFLEEAGK
jgi:hypothetical protein